MRKPVRNKVEEERLASAILDAPKRWEENQHLLLNRATLGVQLISFQQRLRTIVQRYQDDVNIYLQNTLVKPLQGLEKDLDAFVSNREEQEELRVRTVYTVPPTLDFSNIHQVFVTDIRSAIEELPETIRTIPEHAVQGLIDRSLVEVEVISVSLRRVIDYIVEMEFLGPVQQELSLWPPRAQRLYVASQDVQRLISFQMEDGAAGDGETESTETISPLLEKGLERLKAQLAVLEKDRDDLVLLIDSRLDTTVHQLNPYTITRTEGNLQRYVRGHKSRQIQSRFQQLRQRARGVINESLVSLLYRRSEGVLFARQWQETDPYMGSAAIEGIHLIEQLEPGGQVLDKLPLYYRQLFLDLPNITHEFWVGAETQLRRAEEAVDRWNRGVQGGLLVVGEAYAGKTALCQLIAQTHFKREDVFVLNPVSGGSADPDVLEIALKKAFGTSGSIDECFAQLPARCVLIVNDLERWWERSKAGAAALKRIEGWIAMYGKRCLFLVNANLHAFKLIDRIVPMTNQFLGVLTRTPANARQIKEVVMLRHRSAGLHFMLGDQPEEEVSAWMTARLFTSLFDYTRGNVGAALQAWIVSIQRVTQNGMRIEPLKMPDMTVVDAISPLQKAILVHFLLHGQLTFDRLRRISELEASHLSYEMRGLERMGWLQKNEQEILRVNRFLLPHLTQAFVERRLI